MRMRFVKTEKALSGRSNSSAQDGEKGSGIGSLTANFSLLASPGEANGRQTERRHGLGIAAGPCGNYSTATAPCAGPRTSLFRQFAPELFLPSVGLPRLPAGAPSGPTAGPEGAVYPGICVFRSSDWTGRNNLADSIPASGMPW